VVRGILFRWRRTTKRRFCFAAKCGAAYQAIQQRSPVRATGSLVNADNAIVGDVNPSIGGGAHTETKDQPNAITHAPQPALWSENPQRKPVPVSGDAVRPLPVHGGPPSGTPKGNKNVLKHGWCTRCPTSAAFSYPIDLDTVSPKRMGHSRFHCSGKSRTEVKREPACCVLDSRANLLPTCAA